MARAALGGNIKELASRVGVAANTVSRFENGSDALGDTLRRFRRVFEEAGIRVFDVRYIASQPWPFPSSLMIGCWSRAEDDALTIDETEMAEVEFFTRAQVQAAMAGDGPFVAPPPHAIAHHLMQWWIEQ